MFSPFGIVLACLGSFWIICGRNPIVLDPFHGVVLCFLAVVVVTSYVFFVVVDNDIGVVDNVVIDLPGLGMCFVRYDIVLGVRSMRVRSYVSACCIQT